MIYVDSFTSSPSLDGQSVFHALFSMLYICILCMYKGVIYVDSSASVLLWIDSLTFILLNTTT